MCLAIYKPRGVRIPENALEEGFRANPHGAGFAYVTSGRIEVVKGLMTFNDFLSAWQLAEGRQAIVHFRWATHGSRGEDMTHPFWVSRETAMIHNGMLEIPCSGDNSDTAQYVHDVLSPMARRDQRFFARPWVKKMAEDAIRGSKMVFLRRTGEWCIWNEGAGHWKDGAWFSNHGYVRTASAIGFRNWKWADDDTPVVVGHPDPVIRKCDRSSVYSQLAADEKWTYQDLVEEGWGTDDLDDIVQGQGPAVLEKLLSRSAAKDTEIPF